ncbi:MAG TPA: hypothetical protein VE975_00280 [Actinomycetota bacterium]|jgi:hypothetical protein|nr:hypothetical protein [Actinomycetota bacterium]
MQAPHSESPAAGRTITAACADVLRAPYRTFLLLALLADAASARLPSSSGPSALTFFVFSGLTLLIQLSLTLVAGSVDPSGSADAWIRAALRRRCFWRYTVTSILTLILVGVGGLGFVVGAVIVAGFVALAQPASVLERLTPGQALPRSAQVSKGRRGAVMAIFAALILVPSLLPATFLYLPLFGVKIPFGRALAVASGLVATVFSIAGVIALTRMFVALGGRASPSLDQLAEEPLGVTGS